MLASISDWAQSYFQLCPPDNHIHVAIVYSKLTSGNSSYEPHVPYAKLLGTHRLKRSVSIVSTLIGHKLTNC